MQLQIDLDTWAFTQRGVVISRLWSKRRDTVPLEVQFSRSGRIVELHPEASGRCVLAVPGQYNAAPLLRVSEWEKTGTGDQTRYIFRLALDRPKINELFDIDPTIALASVRLEISYTEEYGWLTPPDIQFDIANDYVFGEESEEPFDVGLLKDGVIPLNANRLFHAIIDSPTEFEFAHATNEKTVIVRLTSTGGAMPIWPVDVIWMDGVEPPHPPEGTALYQFVATGGHVLGLATGGFLLP